MLLVTVLYCVEPVNFMQQYNLFIYFVTTSDEGPSLEAWNSVHIILGAKRSYIFVCF